MIRSPQGRFFVAGMAAVLGLWVWSMVAMFRRQNTERMVRVYSDGKLIKEYHSAGAVHSWIGGRYTFAEHETGLQIEVSGTVTVEELPPAK